VPPIRAQIRRGMGSDHLSASETDRWGGRSGDIVAGPKVSETGIIRVEQNHDPGESAFHFHLTEIQINT